ncbi:MAG: DUF938 domain-containing protein [Methylosarcina sp.]
MMLDKPFSQSCENNKDPILQVIRTIFDRPVTVWEIGSGTGQHACYFARQLPHIQWQPTDLDDRLQGIRLWLECERPGNVKPPLKLDVADLKWPCRTIEALFTANTLHIMSWEKVRLFFKGFSIHAAKGAIVCIYGPFNYRGTYTSHSNARFDQWLKARDPLSGIRDFEEVEFLARQNGLALLKDVPMPANNRLLILNKIQHLDS